MYSFLASKSISVCVCEWVSGGRCPVESNNRRLDPFIIQKILFLDILPSSYFVIFTLSARARSTLSWYYQRSYIIGVIATAMEINFS